MTKQEARQIPVTIAVMKVSGVVVRTPTERIKKGQRINKSLFYTVKFFDSSACRCSTKVKNKKIKMSKEYNSK